MSKESIVKEINSKFEILARTTSASKLKLLAEEILSIIHKLSEQSSEEFTTEINSLNHTINKEINYACNAETEWINDSTSENKKQELEKYINQSISQIKLIISNIINS